MSNNTRSNFQAHPFHFKNSLSNSRDIKNSKSRSDKIPKRLFSATPLNRADPLIFLAGSFAIPYPSNLLFNALSGTFISLIGMGSTLFFLTVSLSGFFSYNPEYGPVLQRLDNIFLLYENFISTEQQAINRFLVNFNNYTPENLSHWYFLLQEHITVREALFDALSNEINNSQIELTAGPVMDRINQIFEDLRSGGNNIMDLVRQIEGRLNIPEEHRIPSFWFED